MILNAPILRKILDNHIPTSLLCVTRKPRCERMVTQFLQVMLCTDFLTKE